MSSADLRRVSRFALRQTYSITHQLRPIRDQLEDLSLTIAHALKMGFRVRANLAVTIECPYEGVVPPSRVADIAEELIKMGVFEVSLEDTTGRGDPGTVGRLIREVAGRIGIEKVAGNVSRASLRGRVLLSEMLIRLLRVALQFRDTFGLGISNVLTALSVSSRTRARRVFFSRANCVLLVAEATKRPQRT